MAGSTAGMETVVGLMTRGNGSNERSIAVDKNLDDDRTLAVDRSEENRVKCRSETLA